MQSNVCDLVMYVYKLVVIDSYVLVQFAMDLIQMYSEQRQNACNDI